VDPYRWGWDAEAVVLVPALSVGYLLALRRFPAPPWRIASFFAGQVLLLAVFATPVETMAMEFLLSAHLLQNVVIAEWAPALFVLGLPPALAASIGRLPGARLLTSPLVALPIWLLTYFLWHLPAAYDAALRHPSTLLHAEHLCYLAAGCLLWWPVLQDSPWRLRTATRAAYLFAAFVFASPLGLLLALLPRAVYGFYEQAPRIWGLSPLTDQQIAGLTMAAEQAVVFFAVFTVYFLRFLREEEPLIEPVTAPRR
jgi:putative membrane protein